MSIWPGFDPAPIKPGVFKFDPFTKLTLANKGGLGWPGSFPSTPCRTCECEYFRWVGDWNLGFMCVRCRQVWRELT